MVDCIADELERGRKWKTTRKEDELIVQEHELIDYRAAGCFECYDPVMGCWLGAASVHYSHNQRKLGIKLMGTDENKIPMLIYCQYYGYKKKKQLLSIGPKNGFNQKRSLSFMDDQDKMCSVHKHNHNHSSCSISKIDPFISSWAWLYMVAHKNVSNLINLHLHYLSQLKAELHVQNIHHSLGKSV